MNHTRLWVAATIIAFVILTGFVFSVPHTRDVADTSAPLAPAASIPLVTLHDAFKKGIHTITGSLPAPNACTIVSANATLQNSATGTKSILIEISMPNDTGVCLQVSTRTEFQTTLVAPAHLPFTVVVNGSLATTSIL